MVVPHIIVNEMPRTIADDAAVTEKADNIKIGVSALFN